MDELSEEIDVQKDLVEKTLKELESALKKKKSNVIVSGIATYVHNIYNGVENILKRIFKAKGVVVDTKSPTWHKDLLKMAKSENIISATISSKLEEYLVFRHFFVHAYGVMIRFDRFSDLAKKANNVWSAFYTEIEPIIVELDKT